MPSSHQNREPTQGQPHMAFRRSLLDLGIWQNPGHGCRGYMAASSKLHHERTRERGRGQAAPKATAQLMWSLRCFGTHISMDVQKPTANPSTMLHCTIEMSAHSSILLKERSFDLHPTRFNWAQLQSSLMVDAKHSPSRLQVRQQLANL